jgi:hypothetical protein
MAMTSPSTRARNWIAGIKKYYAAKPIMAVHDEACPPGAFKIL